MCLPVVTTLSDVFLGADVQAITGLLANMGKRDKSLFGYVWMISLKLWAVILWEVTLEEKILSFQERFLSCKPESWGFFNAWLR